MFPITKYFKYLSEDRFKPSISVIDVPRIRRCSTDGNFKELIPILCKAAHNPEIPGLIHLYLC